MHMSDALVSPPVFAVTGALSLTLLGVALRRIGRPKPAQAATPDAHDTPAPIPAAPTRLLPLMGVLGAFVFAAQTINFAIPGTGSSGHLIGGILLAALLGPWAALLTLASVLVIQCLVFADGGLMALGCNIFNMAVLSCLVAYPAIFRPLVRRNASTGRIVAASMLACVAALALGALAVTLETEASGITALPTGRFLLFMLPIHLVIGLGEGAATAAVLCVVRRYRPELLAGLGADSGPDGGRTRRALAVIAAAALLLGGICSQIASSKPDGLEWSIERTAGNADPAAPADALHRTAAAWQERTALMPDYGTSLAGLAGSGAILAIALGASYLFRTARRREP